MTGSIIDIFSVLITKRGRMIPISTSTQRTDTTTVDEFLYVFTVLIVLYQSDSIALG